MTAILEEAILRIAMEYIEMADLKLTLAQARRLCNLPPDLCAAALDTLVARGFLVQTREGAFLRRVSSGVAVLPQAS